MKKDGDLYLEIDVKLKDDDYLKRHIFLIKTNTN